MKKIRFGITGSGYMGRTHAEAIQYVSDVAELVAIWGGSRAPDLAARCGVAAEPSLESLVARKDIDAIVITTPQHLHHREAMLAMGAGKHVLIEKPMTTRVEDSDDIIREAARRRLTVGVAHNLRYRVNLPEVRKIIAAGGIGKVQSLHFAMYRQLANAGNFGGNKTSWVNLPEVIGFVIDGLPHGVDAMRWAMGADVKRVAGFSRTFTPGREIEDTTVGILEFTNGAVCTVHTTVASHGDFDGEMAHLQIIGSAGSLDMDGFGPLHMTDRKNGWRFVCEQPPVMADDPGAAYKDGRMHAFRQQIRGFVDAIHGRPNDVATARDGREGLAACLGLLKSSAEGKVIELAQAFPTS
jgi:UDP-N-acetyl-2-amino-2-deoxyglucuronate dehydrogenase